MLLVMYGWIVLYFILGILMALALTAQNDGCPAVETIVTAQLSDKMQPVARCGG